MAKRIYTSTAEADRLVIERVIELAKKRQMPPAQIALAWLLHKPVVTAPIIGASKMNHLDDAVAALSVKLTAEEIASLEQPYIPHAVTF